MSFCSVSCFRIHCWAWRTVEIPGRCKRCWAAFIWLMLAQSCLALWECVWTAILAWSTNRHSASSPECLYVCSLRPQATLVEVWTEQTGSLMRKPQAQKRLTLTQARSRRAGGALDCMNSNFRLRCATKGQSCDPKSCLTPGSCLIQQPSELFWRGRTLLADNSFSESRHRELSLSSSCTASYDAWTLNLSFGHKEELPSVQEGSLALVCFQQSGTRALVPALSEHRTRQSWKTAAGLERR